MDRSPPANALCTELQRIIRIRLKFSFKISLSPNEASMNVKVLQSCYNLYYIVHDTVYQTGYQPPPRRLVLGIHRLSITLFSGKKLRDLSVDLCYPGAIMWSLIGWRRWLWGSLQEQKEEVRYFTEFYMCQSLPLACSVIVCVQYVVPDSCAFILSNSAHRHRIIKAFPHQFCTNVSFLLQSQWREQVPTSWVYLKVYIYRY